MYTKGIFTPPGARRHDGDVSEHARRRQLERPVVRPGTRPRVHEHHEPRPGRADGTSNRCEDGRVDIRADHAVESARSDASGISRRRIPCSAPPFGELVAVDVNTASIAWRVPLGVFDDLKARGFDKTGTPNMGGTIATAGGLIFVGGTIDRRFRAFDAETGAHALGNDARGERSRHADDVPRKGRPAIRRGCRWWRRHSQVGSRVRRSWRSRCRSRKARTLRSCVM